jgi:hypothetical protein
MPRASTNLNTSAASDTGAIGFGNVTAGAGGLSNTAVIIIVAIGAVVIGVAVYFFKGK